MASRATAAVLMKRAIVASGAISLVVPFILAGPVLAAGPARAGPAYQTVVVRMASAAVRASAVLRGLPGTPPMAAPQNRYVLRVPSDQVSEVLARLRTNPDVASASVARAVHATSGPDDMCYVASCPATDDNGLPTHASEGYLAAIGAPAAWQVTHGTGQVVAVLDSGVDASHPDLTTKIRRRVNVCAGDDQLCADPPGQTASDGLGHGTHVTGVVGAITDNHQGVASLGWNVRADEYKVLDSQGAGNTADVATAIYDAVAAGDRVINMSLANSACQVDPNDCGPDPDEAAAVEYAIEHNVVVVAAAGNDGLNSPVYPASYPGVLAVAATDNSGAVQFFSQWGSAANIAAPGFNIVSTWPTNLSGNLPPYRIESGTSMAAPQVAAAAALMISHNPKLSGPQITTVLETSARHISGGHPIKGGLLNVPAALLAEAHPPHVFNGYEMAGADGSVYPFGSVGYFGAASGHPLARPVVGIAMKGDGLGYWMDASDGGVFTFGRAGFFGSAGNIRLNKPVVGMAATPDGRGYWLVASDGGIFTYGDAGFFGSAGNIRLNKPVVGMAATPDGRGYWLVASDGGIFTYGDAHFDGSTGNITLNKPVVSMMPTGNGGGYWLVASDGGIFAYGNAGFYGSTGNLRLARPVVGATPTPKGRGYRLVASDGGVFSFGDAEFWGSTGGVAIPAPIVGGAS